MYRSYASVFRPYMSALMPLRLKTKAAMEPGSAAVKLRAAAARRSARAASACSARSASHSSGAPLALAPVSEKGA